MPFLVEIRSVRNYSVFLVEVRSVRNYSVFLVEVRSVRNSMRNHYHNPTLGPSCAYSEADVKTSTSLSRAQTVACNILNISRSDFEDLMAPVDSMRRSHGEQESFNKERAFATQADQTWRNKVEKIANENVSWPLKGLPKTVALYRLLTFFWWERLKFELRWWCNLSFSVSEVFQVKFMCMSIGWKKCVEISAKKACFNEIIFLQLRKHLVQLNSYYGFALLRCDWLDLNIASR